LREIILKQRFTSMLIAHGLFSGHSLLQSLKFSGIGYK